MTLIALVFGLGGGCLVYYYQTFPQFTASMILGKDLFVAFLTISGIAIAAENMRRSALAAQASVALRFVERWNDPKLSEFRAAWHVLFDEIKNLNAADVVHRIDGDEKARVTITDLLNLFEEIAHSVNTKAADKELMRRLMGETIREYYTATLPWVGIRRLKRPDAWIEIQAMLDDFPLLTPQTSTTT